MNLSGKETLENVFDLLGMDFAELAKAIGFREGRVRAWYSRPRISLDGVFALSDTFGLSTEWLLYGRGVPFHAGVTDSIVVQRIVLKETLEEVLNSLRFGGDSTDGGDPECLEEAA